MDSVATLHPKSGANEVQLQTKRLNISVHLEQPSHPKNEMVGLKTK